MYTTQDVSVSGLRLSPAAVLDRVERGERFTVTRDGEPVAATAERADEDKGALDQAAEWVRETLSEGPMLSKDLNSKAEAVGFSVATLKRAKAKLAVKAVQRRDGSRAVGWSVCLPHTEYA